MLQWSSKTIVLRGIVLLTLANAVRGLVYTNMNRGHKFQYRAASSSESDDIEKFRERMTNELTESGPESDLMEAARSAGTASADALGTENPCILVDCRSQELEATGSMRDEWFTEFRQACNDAADTTPNFWFSPDDLSSFRSQLQSTKKENTAMVVINPRFPMDPIEFDNAITAYAIWPLRLRAVGGEDGIRLCVFRRFPRPWALYLALHEDDDFIKVFNFPSDSPPSDAEVKEAAFYAIENINRSSSSSSSS